MSPTIMIGAGMVLTAVMNLLRCGCYLAVILACIKYLRKKYTLSVTVRLRVLCHLSRTRER